MPINDSVTIRIGLSGARRAAAGVRGISAASLTAAGSVTKLLAGLTAIGSTGTVVALGAIAKSSVNAAAAFEGYEVRLRALLGSQSEATTALENFTKQAARTPFAVSQVVEGATTLASAALGNRERLEELTLTAGNLAAVTGLSFQEAAGNLQRSLSAGIGAADLFRERGVRALIESIEGIPDATKLSTQELEAAFQRVFGAGGVFGRAAEELSFTLGGAISNVGDASDAARVALGRALSPAVVATARTVLIPFFEDLRDIIVENQDTIGEFARDAVQFLARSFGLLVEAGVETLRVFNQLRGAGTALQGVFAEFQLGRAERRLDQLRDQRAQFIGVGVGNEAFNRLTAEIAEQEAVVARARATVDQLALDYGNAGRQADQFGLFLDKVEQRAEALQQTNIDLADGIRDVGDAADDTGLKVSDALRGVAQLTDEAQLAVAQGLQAAGAIGTGGGLGGGQLATANLEGVLQGEQTAQQAAQDREREIKRFGGDVGRQTADALTGALNGRAPDIAGILADQSSKLMGQAFEDLFADLAKDLADSVEKALNGLDLGGLGGALAGAAGAGLSLLSGAIGGTSAQTRNSLVRSTVESAQATRGIVAGPTSIPIFQVGEAIEDAFDGTNDILLRILAAIETSAAATAAAAAEGSPGATLSQTTPSLV